VINRGGEKISPHEVEDVLASAAEVAEAVCFPVAYRTLGEEIAAAVVLREGEVVSEDDLRTFAFERLAPSKVPRRIFIVDALPKGPTGKLQRMLLAQQLNRAGSALGALGGVGKSP
jgi:acyl-CoA synthetase (AMP-forming)/AMP-acid ligase II